MERRQFIAGSAVAALAVSTSPIAANSAPDRKEWEAAKSALDNIMAEDAAFTPGWWEAWNKCNAECDSIPHVTLRRCVYTGSTTPVTTANTRFVAAARRTLANMAAGKEHWDNIPSLNDQLQLLRDTVAAADERDRKVQVVRDRYDMDHRDAKAEELGDRISDAQERLMAMPAPCLAALRWKLDHTTDNGTGWASWSDDYVSQLNADIARLLPEAG